MVKRRRLELPRLATLPPQSSASTNSATSPFWASCWIRTNDNRITNRVLWPTELKRQLYRVCRRTRTDDHLNHNQGLCQLSYTHHVKIWYSIGESNPDYKNENLVSWPLDEYCICWDSWTRTNEALRTADLQSAAIAAMRCLNLSIDDRTRTCDHSIPNAAFYQLNYIYVCDSYWTRTNDPLIKSQVL